MRTYMQQDYKEIAGKKSSIILPSSINHYEHFALFPSSLYLFT